MHRRRRMLLLTWSRIIIALRGRDGHNAPETIGTHSVSDRSINAPAAYLHTVLCTDAALLRINEWPNSGRLTNRVGKLYVTWLSYLAPAGKACALGQCRLLGCNRNIQFLVNPCTVVDFHVSLSCDTDSMLALYLQLTWASASPSLVKMQQIYVKRSTL